VLSVRLADAPKKIKPDFASEVETGLPNAGLFEFYFLDKQTTAATDRLMEASRMELLLTEINRPTVSTVDKLDCIRAIVGDSWLSTQQLGSLLEEITEDKQANRINLFCGCYHRLTDFKDSATVLGLLSADERVFALTHLGQASLAFYQHNPTGHHKLDCARPAQRDVVLRLLQLRNEMHEVEEALYKYYENRGGGKRDLSAIGVVWRNSKCMTAPLTLQQSWAVPYQGIIEVDFVDVRLPPPEASPLTDDEFKELILDLWDAKSDLLDLHIISNESMVRALREVTNARYVSCTQVARMIGRFDPSRDATIREEILVACWARTVDFHGLPNVLNLLTPHEQSVVKHRLGPIKTFDELMAVGFYELNLQIPIDRFVFQELVHLSGISHGHARPAYASVKDSRYGRKICLESLSDALCFRVAGKEPGDSMVQLTIDGKDSEAKTEWLAGGIPEHSIISLFFVRTPACLNQVFEKGICLIEKDICLIGETSCKRKSLDPPAVYGRCI